MTITYRCGHCGKSFYFYGDTEDALRELVMVRAKLERNGFCVNKVPSAWKAVQSNAKCCTCPIISVVLRSEEL